MANPAPTINQINAFNATQGTIIDFNIIGGTELVRSNRIYIYDLSDNSLICTHLYVSTESIHELPANTDSSIVYESGKSSADFVNGAQYYAQIQTYTDTAGTEGGSGLSVAKMFWCLVDPTLTITTIPSTISTTSYNVSATYDANTSVVSNIIQQYQFNLYSATGSLLQSSGVIVGSGTQQGTSTAYDISYNFTGLSVGSSYYVVVDVTTTQGMGVSAQSNTFTVSIETPTLGEATVVNNACDGYISVTSNLSGEYGGSASGEIATFVTDSVNDVSSLKVTLTPQQDATPWIGTDHDTAPYLNRAMPTQSNDYNRESGVIVGGTVGWNQLVPKTADSSTNVINNADGSFTVNSGANEYFILGTIDIIEGHKYIASCKGGHPVECYFRIDDESGNSWISAVNDTVYNAGFSASRREFIRAYGASQQYNVIPQLIDLTAMFGSTIADYIYSLEQANAGAGVAWFRKYFPEDYYPYSANTLQSVQATAHKTYDSGGNVIGNYALDSSVTLNGLFQLDNGELKAYGDIYPPSGDIQRLFARVDLGTLPWKKVNTSSGAIGYYFGLNWADLTPLVKKTSSSTVVANIICAKYETKGSTYVYERQDDKTIGVHTNGAIVVADSAYSTAESFKTAMSGIYLVYELATPTTETATAYTNPQVVDDGGTEEYVTANYVPVGHDSTYSLECPISGYDEVSANVVGKNWLDPSLLKDQVGWNNFSIQLEPNTEYTMSSNIPQAKADNELAAYFLRTNINPNPSTLIYSNHPFTLTTPSDGIVQIQQRRITGTDSFQNYEWQIEKGSTATDYEPYQGTTYTTDLPQTVYGGTVDLVSGEVVIDKKLTEITSWSGSFGATAVGYAVYKALSDRRLSRDSMSNMFSISDDGIDSMSVGNFQGDSGVFTTWSFILPPSITSLAEAQAWLANLDEPLVVTETLATPQTYQLTPQDIQTLVGTNNVWSEDGDVEITYNIPITNLLVKRQDVADVSGTWLTLYSRPITQASDMDFTFIDFLNQYGKTYKYALVPLLTQTQSGVEVEVEGGYTVSDEVQSIFDGVFIADATELQKCKANVGYGDVDMNQAVGTITPIGAKYPVVITNSKNQYHNGSITGTIVPDDYYSNGNLSRIDMVNKRNELEQFLTNKRAKIIKDWNGNIWLVMIMDNINCTFNNEYGMGIVDFTANWIEVGDPTNQQDLQATGLIDVGGA